MNLVLLCLAAFALVGTLVSAVVFSLLPVCERIASGLSSRGAARLWWVLSALPAVFGLLTVSVSLFPALGIGHDHCLAHEPHHPHLCPRHLGQMPGTLLVAAAAFLVLRIFYVALRLTRDLTLMVRTSDALLAASETAQGASIFASVDPQAFVLGTLRPRVYISRGLIALGNDVASPVLAHELVHVRRKDLLWRFFQMAFATVHLPNVAEVLRARLILAQELAADEEAANMIPEGRVRLAEALLTLARLGGAPTPGISFTHGDVNLRIRSLLAEPRSAGIWLSSLLTLAMVLSPIIVVLLHDAVHHALETLLGALN